MAIILQVRNKGPSPAEYADVTILVPYKYGSKEYLLYLMDVQVRVCHVIQILLVVRLRLIGFKAVLNQND